MMRILKSETLDLGRNVEQYTIHAFTCQTKLSRSELSGHDQEPPAPSLQHNTTLHLSGT